MSYNPTYTDKELLLLVSKGDESAFEQLYDRYLPLIQPVILQIVKSEAVVKDLVQGLFLRLWLNREKLTEIQEPKSYIFRMVYNQSFKYLKKQLTEEKAALQIAADQGGNDLAPSLEQHLDMTEVRRLIEAGIQAMPAQSGLIYRLNRIQGHKPQEIADQLGISVQSVRNSLTRSGKFLKEYLQHQGITLPLLLIALAMQ
ncbi:sigma-70 family RNA polymerase sigma factor [Pseudoflavitalea sp. G-6-1-2]|uniref:sigma-70 family RNA polymerase sigma factor n=1 Tax=Pseudoflavitalea sp. G-6-1-2 TaxID=2728841 RepID=UPI00146A89BD|nr:sigma-70 family RNA polymerase sigma factor [Pseudoflavitalea sp. G-6-1-2]NML23642.1 sigma-70 family RNA polymerase sigma factor [Pseudoflavitalea sp. G-6-1-2]